MACLNWLVTTVVVAVTLPAYRYRISVEEAMLVRKLGEGYRDYVGRTWRLIPFVF